ncbi:NADPH-dependent 2,4-dienoyl-CoA reductase/sulfur reductase-like enzyme [Mycobacterium sp. URHB0021]|jgi:sulfide:quinone oxidoreductase
MPLSNSYRVAIVGGGNAGISLAARLRRAGTTDIGVIEPAESHFYQPLWTLVGGGCAQAAQSRRSEASVMPRGVGWIKDHAQELDPGAQTVTTRSGTSVL